MGNEREGRIEDKGNREMPNMKKKKKKKKKEVLISVYIQGDHYARESNEARSKIGQDAKMRGYDRRARLLAYAQELRLNTDSIPKPKENPKNTKDPKFGVKRMSYENLKTRVRSRNKYLRLVPEVDIHCRPKSTTLEKNANKSGGRRNFHFVGLLRRALKGFCRE